LNPPDAAAVFAVDEKSQTQALNRSDRSCHCAHHPQRASHDYQRNGTVDLFAALDIARRTVITDIKKRHTPFEFIAFLNKITWKVPTELDVHVILDNLATHKTPKVQEWLFATLASIPISRPPSGHG
jgi:hypothetical protein